MKQVIKLNESQFHKMIAESISKILKEVNLQYGKDTYSFKDYEFDTNPNNMVGYTTNSDNSVTDVMKEDFIAFAQRLENLTKTEWTITNNKHYGESHNQRGYDSTFNYGYDNYYFTTKLPDNKTYTEIGKLMDMIVKLSNTFFGKESCEISLESHLEVVVTVNAYKKGIHSKSRNIQFGKNFGSGQKNKPESQISYTHPYDSEYDDENIQ